MNRICIIISSGVLACALLAAPLASAAARAARPTVAVAANAPVYGAAATAARATIASRIVAHGTVTGTVTAIDGPEFIIETIGKRTGVVNALIGAANRVTEQDTPYVYGGGHAQAGIASIGIPGAGHHHHTKGFDCSGSVAAVLAGAGLWQPGTGVPNDAGIIAQLRAENLIAPGVGKGPVEVTLYDDPGVHIFTSINGQFFGTSDGGGGGDRRGGAGWLDDGAPDASTTSYKKYHLLPPVLTGTTNAGHIIAFQGDELPNPINTFQVNEKLKVSYAEKGSGNMFATAIAFPGSAKITGTVQSIAADGSSFTIQTGSGTSLTLQTDGLTDLLDGLADGDTTAVTYTASGSTLTARSVTVTATAPPASSTATSTTGPGFDQPTP
jgi:hypothetical protein